MPLGVVFCLGLRSGMSTQGSAGEGALLDGAWRKLAWGSDHLADLVDDTDAALDSKENTAVAKRQTDTRYTIHTYFPDWPLAEWSLRLGDAIHSIRGALDHATWEIVCRSSGPPKSKREQRRIQFPIFDCPKDFSKATVLRYVDDGVRTIFEDAQPYKVGGVLQFLAALSNDDKHRLLLPSILSYGEGGFNIGIGSNDDVRSVSEPVITIHTNDPLESGAEIGYFDAEIVGDDPQVSVEGHFPGFIAFVAREGELILRPDTIAKIAFYVEGVLKRLELNLQGFVPR